MDKVVLPPRAKLANYFLLGYLVINAVVIAYVALYNPFVALFFPVQLALAAGVFFRVPIVYLVLMGVSFISLVLSLHSGNLLEAAFAAVVLWLAFYIRSNLYFLRDEAVSAPGG